jgi:hypothetical protein
MIRPSLLALFTSTALAAVCGLGALAACGGSTSSSPNDADAATGTGGGGGGGSGGGEGGSADGSTSGDGGTSDGGKQVTHAPVIHRATAAACSHDRGPGDFDTQNMNAQCGSDAECTMGTNGRCLATKVAARTNYCSYDTCFTDTAPGSARAANFRMTTTVARRATARSTPTAARAATARRPPIPAGPTSAPRGGGATPRRTSVRTTRTATPRSERSASTTRRSRLRTGRARTRRSSRREPPALITALRARRPKRSSGSGS